MKIGRLIFGLAKTGDTKPEIKTLKVKEKSTIFGGFADLFRRNLSHEKRVDTKLIKAFYEWVYANVNKLAQEVSKTEIKLYRQRMTGGEIELLEVDEHPVLTLLDRFNETTTSSDGFYVTEAHLSLAGDAFWYLEGENIHILQPDHVELQFGEYADTGERQVIGYKYEITVDGKRFEAEFDPEEIIHFKVPNPQNPYRGKSTVEAAAQTIDTDNATAEAMKKFFENGMIANFILTTDKGLNDDQVKSLESKLRSARTGLRNAFRIPIFSRGLKPETIQMSNKEIELIQLEKWWRDKIMVMFENTPASLGIIEDVNRANAEATLAEWRRSVIKTRMKRIVDNLNEFLLPKYEDGLILGFEDPAPEDRNKKIAEIKELYSNANKPVITLNEAREMLEFDTVTEEGADDVKQPMPELMQDPNDDKRLPKPLKNVNWKRHFRRNKWYADYTKHLEIYEASRELAEQVIRSRKKAKKPAKRRVDNFWKRVADIIEEYEQQFNLKLVQFITQVVDEAVTQLDNDEARSTGELFDRERKLVEAQSLFTPILMQATALAGQEANALLGIKEPYIPKTIKGIEDDVRKQVDMFAVSMLDTDRDILAKIIADGLQEGAGVPAIRSAIEAKFAEFSKKQAERITRTEVATAANKGILDSYRQSGVVIGKQWLTAPGACPYCVPLNGKLVDLDTAYFDKGSEYQGDAKTPLKLDYRTIEAPPLHPNCRCTTISVIEGLEPLLEPKSIEDMRAMGETIKLRSQIAELEEQVDKRTKQFRKIKRQREKEQEKSDSEITELKKYAKRLEALVDEE